MEDKEFFLEEDKGAPLESLEAACRAYIKAQSKWDITRTKESLSAYKRAREYLKDIALAGSIRSGKLRWGGFTYEQASAALEEYGLTLDEVVYPQGRKSKIEPVTGSQLK